MIDPAPPQFPGADDVQLSPRWMRDLRDLGRSLKFSNPQELLDFWTLFVKRLKLSGETFDETAVLNHLLRNIYQAFEEQVAAVEDRLEKFRADQRIPAEEVRRSERLVEEQRAYRRRLLSVLPDLRRLLQEAAHSGTSDQ